MTKSFKIKDNLKLIGTLELEQVDRDGKVIRNGTYKNLVVETGVELILDLLINTVSDYDGNVILTNMACGSINIEPTVDDWNLYGEGTLNQGGAICRVVLDPQTARTLQTVEFHGVFTTGDFPVIPYSCGEFGAFVSNLPPLNDPQTDSTQRARAMFNRLVLDPPWIKYDDGTDLRFKYTVTIG
jgi:hypothetical protein